MTIPPASCALLFEYSAVSTSELSSVESEVRSVFNRMETLFPPIIAQNEKEIDNIWTIRNGLLSSLGKNRPAGTTAIIEDVAFPAGELTPAITELRELLNRSGYSESGIYGHGLDGNVHFIIAQEFSSEASKDRYAKFNGELSDLVLRFNGSLKAEHGTGRAMAEYVPKHWSPQAYEIMIETKRLFDTNNILNPGVVFPSEGSDKKIVFKDYPVLGNASDKCIECGFCETVCPSRNLTLTPRKRIRLMREIAKSGPNELGDMFKYYGLNTCAADGLCAENCPVGINTGAIIKSLREQLNKRLSRSIAKFVAEEFSYAQSLGRFAVRAGNISMRMIGMNAINKIIRATENITSTELPKVTENMGNPPYIPHVRKAGSDIIYFPCCVSRIMGKPTGQQEGIIEKFLTVSERAGLKLTIPNDISGYCCGMSMQSKGFPEAFAESANRLIIMLWDESDAGRAPILFDSSSCSFTVKNFRDVLTEENRAKYDQMTILDSVEYLNDWVLPKLEIKRLAKCSVLHNTCSQTKMKLNHKLLSIAERCSEKVITPESNGCCGFAGDRGFLFPELTESATRDEAEELSQIDNAEYYSSNLPCETGMSNATAKHYLPIVYLVDTASK
jgi:D-lactate dehydrogenase